MDGKTLRQLVTDGVHPVVTFTAAVLDKESYLEAGMRGRLVATSAGRNDMFKLYIDLSEFEDFNRQFESANYYDKNGVPRLTAREAGFYTGPAEEIYVGEDEEVDFCEIEEPHRLRLYEEYLKAAAKVTYVQWLEDRILLMQKSSPEGELLN